MQQISTTKKKLADTRKSTYGGEHRTVVALKSTRQKILILRKKKYKTQKELDSEKGQIVTDARVVKFKNNKKIIRDLTEKIIKASNTPEETQELLVNIMDYLFSKRPTTQKVIFLERIVKYPIEPVLTQVLFTFENNYISFPKNRKHMTASKFMSYLRNENMYHKSKTSKEKEVVEDLGFE